MQAFITKKKKRMASFRCICTRKEEKNLFGKDLPQQNKNKKADTPLEVYLAAHGRRS